MLLDDFGAGYSGLGYLRELAFDCIKIDRSFISTLHTQDKSRKIIGAIQDLAKSLGLATVAEGIENQEVWDAVSRSAAPTARATISRRPVPASEVAAFLRGAGRLRRFG